jgi:nitrous oxide reductase accessory protein NosL
MRTLIPLLALMALAACTREERTTLPQPQSGYQTPIDLRNDGYFERLNIPEKQKPQE